MIIEQTADMARPDISHDLIAEANHRIANSLSLVSTLARRQMSALGDGGQPMERREVRAVLADLSGRIEAVGRLHRMMSQARSQDPVDVGSYLQQVANEVITSAAKPDTVILHFAAELGCRVPAERALYVGLIVVELVLNAVKHAHPAGVLGHIEIRCRRDPKAVVVTVADDGVGLPEQFDSGEPSHSGMRLLQSLVHQIGGTISFDSDGLGLRCTLEAPIVSAV